MVEKIIPQGAQNIKPLPERSYEPQPELTIYRRPLKLKPRPLRRAAIALRAAKELVLGHARSVRNSASLVYERARVFTQERVVRDALPRSAGITALAAAVAIVIATAFVAVGLEVYVDGEPVGYVATREEIDSIVSGVEAKASEILGYPYIINTDVGYQLELFAKQDRTAELDKAAVERALFADIDEIRQLYVLSVDGVVIGANADGDALREMTDELLARAERYATDAESVELLADVAVSLQYTAAENEKTLDEIEQIVNSNAVESLSCTVLDGDSFEDIAAKNGMSVETLAELNPDVDPDEIAAGDTLNLGDPVPFLSIKVTKTEQTSEVIEHTTEYVYSSSYWEGDSFVTTRGVDGEKLVTSEVVYINGKESERTITDETITREPTTEVITLGTRNFILPFPGYKLITSTFGWRTYNGRADNHTGIDFAGAYGSKVRASYSGTVSFAGWKGNYGYCVIIDHGSGYQTLYAHNSRLAVKVGQYVEQGDTISYVGSTGKSSGNHCHFEIRINGTPVNPWRYLFN